MEHVSTLCALSTVGIAATGYALARPERRAFSTPSSLGRRNTWSRGYKPPLPFTGHSTRSSSHERETPSHDPVPPSTLDGQINSIRPGQPTVETTSFRRRSSGRVRRQTYTGAASRVSTDTPGRPSSSWRQRLSLISSSTDSPIPTRPPSAKHGSVSSIPPEPEIEVRVPNKLVKRSASQHSFSTPLSTRPFRSAGILSLRRPATSHQRAAERSYYVAANRNMDANAQLSAEIGGTTPIDETLEPFFRSPHEDNLDRRLKRLDISPRQKDQLIHVLSSEGPEYPILTLSTSVPTRRGTRHHRGNGAPGEMPSNVAINQTPANPKRTEQHMDPFAVERRTPRHSSSAGNIARRASTKQPPAPRRRSPRPPPNGQIFSSPKSRNISNPLPRESGPTSVERGMQPRLRRKRNFTDSTVVRRPSTAVEVSGEKPATSLATVPGSRRPSLPNAPSAQPVRSSLHVRPPQHTEHELFTIPSSHPQTAPSSSPIARNSRSKRFSNPTSDRTSTLIGSDDTRIFTSGDEDDQSDSAFDSFRTRITASSQSGRRGPRIETIFQDVPSADSVKEASLVFEDLTGQDLFLPHVSPRSSRSSLSNDMDSHSTPIPLASLPVHSQPTKASPVSLAHDGDGDLVLPSDAHVQDANKVHHSPEQVQMINHDNSHSSTVLPSGSPLPTRNKPVPRNRPNLFDWSEHPTIEVDANNSDNRPKTVDGKRGTDVRGSRGHGRKAPTTIHLRSQSVPVSRDSMSPNDGRQPTSKFGTWGLGHKGVSEHWDGDFDFGDSDEPSAEEDAKETIEKDAHMMKVPKSIMERQANVHGQFGHVQELTLLVEELKRLRLQGGKLDIINGPTKDLWKEAEGIINLATIDDEGNAFSPPSSPTSRLSFDETESNTSSRFSRTQKRPETDARRAPLADWPNPGSNNLVPMSHRDPSARAKSVLDTIYQQRELREPNIVQSSYSSHPQKLPFDTQSLRDLVARAGIVTRSLKEVIRKVEDVTTPIVSSPPPAPPFSHIFNHTKASAS